jgi:hypothetical protein
MLKTYRKIAPVRRSIDRLGKNSILGKFWKNWREDCCAIRLNYANRRLHFVPLGANSNNDIVRKKASLSECNSDDLLSGGNLNRRVESCATTSISALKTELA